MPGPVRCGRCVITVHGAFATPLAIVTGRRKVYYGWYVLAGSVVAMALGSGVSFWALTLYVEPLEEQFGWSRAQVTGAISVSLGASGLTSPFIGRWIDRSGPRNAILVGAILTSVTYVLLATTATLWQWYLYSIINTIFRQLMFFLPFQALISRFFDRRRGIALGILGTGFSLGGLVVVLLMRWVIDRVGWDGSFVFSAVAISLVFVPIGLFLVKNSPEDIGQHMDGDPEPPAGSAPGAPVNGVTLGQALRTPLFWALAGAVTLFFFGMFAWLIHQVPFYESVGISRERASFLVSLSAGLGIITRLSFGVLVDRVRATELAALSLAACLMAAMITLSISTSWPAIGLFLAFYIVGAGAGPMMEAILLTRAFGVAHFATIFGAFMVVETMGQMVSPVAAGWIYDRTGSYDLVLLLWIGTFASSLTLFGIASRLPRPVFGQAVPVAPS